MVTFSICIVLLILGYFIYGRFVERFFGADPSREVPSAKLADGVDYVSMPTWKAFMIQFLNIAGLGPVFGAIMGAKFGTSAYLWIVFGTIFGGAVHDYFSGMLSLRNNGESLPNIIGRYLGKGMKSFFTFFSILLMILVVCVFVAQPAELLSNMTPDYLSTYFWMAVIFIYYLVATLFPIDKVIGRLYPILGFALLFMAAGILVALYSRQAPLPEIWNGFGTKYESAPIFPMMFISIACGAVSGFHATQSPMMARCIRSEKEGRKVFYGSMVAEGIVALIWAAAATAYFNENGASDAASVVTMNISREWLGAFGGAIALLGVIAAPISSGDTALRSARLMIADALRFTQKGVINRLIISIPLGVVSLSILFYSIFQPDGFSIIWRYFAWCNQVLSVFTLWAITIYLCRSGKKCLITLLPALFMTEVTTTYALLAPECCGIPGYLAYPGGVLVMVTLLFAFLWWKYHYKMHFPRQTRFFK